MLKSLWMTIWIRFINLDISQRRNFTCEGKGNWSFQIVGEKDFLLLFQYYIKSGICQTIGILIILSVCWILYIKVWVTWHWSKVFHKARYLVLCILQSTPNFTSSTTDCDAHFYTKTSFTEYSFSNIANPAITIMSYSEHLYCNKTNLTEEKAAKNIFGWISFGLRWPYLSTCLCLGTKPPPPPVSVFHSALWIVITTLICTKERCYKVL